MLLIDGGGFVGRLEFGRIGRSTLSSSESDSSGLSVDSSVFSVDPSSCLTSGSRTSSGDWSLGGDGDGVPDSVDSGDSRFTVIFFLDEGLASEASDSEVSAFRFFVDDLWGSSTELSESVDSGSSVLTFCLVVFLAGSNAEESEAVDSGSSTLIVFLVDVFAGSGAESESSVDSGSLGRFEFLGAFLVALDAELGSFDEGFFPFPVLCVLDDRCLGAEKASASESEPDIAHFWD